MGLRENKRGGIRDIKHKYVFKIFVFCLLKEREGRTSWFKRKTIGKIIWCLWSRARTLKITDDVGVIEKLGEASIL